MDSKDLCKLDKLSLRDTTSRVKFSKENFCKFYLQRFPGKTQMVPKNWRLMSHNNTLVVSLRGRQWVTISSATM